MNATNSVPALNLQTDDGLWLGKERGAVLGVEERGNVTRKLQVLQIVVAHWYMRASDNNKKYQDHGRKK